jgi:hypothetical protein
MLGEDNNMFSSLTKQQELEIDLFLLNEPE